MTFESDPTSDTVLFLTQTTIVAKKHNPGVKSFCQRLESTGKAKMVIICATMRKLVHIVYGVLKSGKVFDASLAIA